MANDTTKRLSIEEYLDQDERKDLLRLLTAGSVDDGKSAWATPANISTMPCFVTD